MAKNKPKKDAAPAKGSAKRRLYTMEVTLIGGPVMAEFIRANPVISRTIQILGNQTLMDLNDAIFEAFDRDEEHLWEFQFGKKPGDPDAKLYAHPESAARSNAENAERATVDSLDLRPRQVFYYWFDFGDDWWHKIEVATIADQAAGAPEDYPKVVERIGKSPPQYPDLEEEDDEDWDDEDYDEDDEDEEEDDWDADDDDDQ